MKRLKLALFFFFVISGVTARNIKIGLFSNIHSGSFYFRVINGAYALNTAEGGSVELTNGDSLLLTDSTGVIRVQKNKKRLFLAGNLKVMSVTENATIFIASTSKKQNGWNYKGDIQVLVKGRELQLVNDLDLESYVSGAVETEIGRGVHSEMVKVQAILVRTYAISNIDRHAAEGFSLCDGVHCQAYNGFRQYNAGIRKPVLSTRDLVLVKSNQQLALTVYHSNCGGKTANAADVWSGDVTTLIPVTDSFCTKSNNARWEKKISRSEWENYLSACGLTDTMQVYKPLREAYQSCNRTCCIRSDSVTVPLKNLRRDFDLKSSYFQISVNDDTVIFSGKGYGHGVGLCQEGGNAMAALGYTAEQILKFYYKGVSVVRYAEIQPH